MCLCDPQHLTALVVAVHFSHPSRHPYLPTPHTLLSLNLSFNVSYINLYFTRTHSRTHHRHRSACQKKWELVEATKPPRQRRQVPPPPPQVASGCPLPADPRGIDEFNASMAEYRAREMWPMAPGSSSGCDVLLNCERGRS